MDILRLRPGTVTDNQPEATHIDISGSLCRYFQVTTRDRDRQSARGHSYGNFGEAIRILSGYGQGH